MSKSTTKSKPGWPESLLELLEHQHRLVQQLVTLAASQAAMIVDHRTDQLMDLLAKRQSLIDGFTATGQDLLDLTSGLEERLRTAPALQRDRIKMLIDEISQQLALVMRQDEQDQSLLRTNRDGIAQELSNVGTARQARNAYLGSSTHHNRFADQRA